MRRLMIVLLMIVPWLLPVVVAVGSGALIHFAIKSRQRARIDAANTEVREAVKGANAWLKQGSAIDGENVEHRLMEAIAANDVSEKANADTVLETVRTRRAELAADSIFDSAKTLLDAKEIVEAVALIHRYVADRHATKKSEAEQLLADCDLATSEKAALQTLMAMSDERFVQFRDTGKLDDRKITNPILVEIRATTLRRNLETANKRREENKIAEANRQKEENKIAEATRQESERLALAAARAADVAGVWLHKSGSNEPWEITLHPNGKINNPDGQDSWALTGKTLVLRWANSRARGGFWIDTCTVADDGKTYRGVNQQSVPIAGQKAMKKQPANDPETDLYIGQQIRALVGLVTPRAGRSYTSLRRQAADNLKELGPAAIAAVPALATVVLNSGDRLAKQKAIEALGEIGAPQGIGAIGQTLLLTPDPETREAAEDSLLKLLPAIGIRLNMDDAIFLFQVHGLGNKRVSPAIEYAWAAGGLTKDAVANEINRRNEAAAKEENKRRLQKQRDDEYWAKMSVGQAERQARRAEWEKEQQQKIARLREPSPFGPPVPWKSPPPPKPVDIGPRNSYDPAKGGTPQRPNPP